MTLSQYTLLLSLRHTLLKSLHPPLSTALYHQGELVGFAFTNQMTSRRGLRQYLKYGDTSSAHFMTQFLCDNCAQAGR
ncbi:Uncharacterised protein [Yersinia enterocolitica]|nr:Uncharacterised protein [Yersinia enterocolitica]